MKTITESVITFLEKEGFCFSQVDDKSVFRFGTKGKNGIFETYIRVDEADHILECHTLCPVNVSDTRMAATLELIAQINWRLRIGNFEADMEDGQIHFRTSVRTGMGEVGPDIVTHLVFANLITADTFLPAIASVICSDFTADEALAMLKKVKSERPNHRQSSHEHADRFGGRLGDMLGNSSN